ncbi:hypothetical protein FACS189416_5010 [Bacteroidia bacterium]|nr:hypothetical protein FACS189416_5010 [Bacteroidia bacterium]
MQTEIIVAIISAFAVVTAAVIAARRKKGNNESVKGDNYSQTANGNNNTQIQINK